MLDRCDTPLCPPTTNMKPSMTPTPKLILLSAMGATISQASLLGSYRSTLCGVDTVDLTKAHTTFEAVLKLQIHTIPFVSYNTKTTYIDSTICAEV